MKCIKLRKEKMYKTYGSMKKGAPGNRIDMNHMFKETKKIKGVVTLKQYSILLSLLQMNKWVGLLISLIFLNYTFYFIYWNFKYYYPFPVKHPTSLPCLLLLWGWLPYPSPPSRISTLAFHYSGSLGLLRTKGLPPIGARYVNPLLYIQVEPSVPFGWWCNPCELWRVWLFDIVVFFLLVC